MVTKAYRVKLNHKAIRGVNYLEHMRVIENKLTEHRRSIAKHEAVGNTYKVYRLQQSCDGLNSRLIAVKRKYTRENL